MDVCVAPQSYAFHVGMSYNFTVGTASGKHYSFVVKCDNASVKPENLTIVYSDFVPGPSQYISIGYRNDGKTPVIVTKVCLDYESNGVNYWTWPKGWPGRDQGKYIWISCDWRPLQTYTIRLITLANSTYQLTITAPEG